MSSTCLITGASSGIGAATAKYFASQGWTVYAVARSVEKLQQLAITPGIIALPLDLTDTHAIITTAKELANKNIALDLVLLNAGSCEYVTAKNLDLSAFERTFAINFHANVAAIKYLLPLLSLSKKPQLAVVSSMAHFFPFTRSEAYGASKAALSYFVDSLRVDLAKTEIQICLIEPGFVDTPLTQKNDFKMPFLLSVDTAAKRIYHGLDNNKLRIRFPIRLSVMLKLMACLPYGLRCRLAAKMADK
ncbi:SDR family NAD(P)-dependent oxidoreductase [Rheinheimera salexigens]|uniref:Short-chain dehydrogenase n=1 Tax=Rheinheimera salexigens TaxID=1628148 RepID=A0A1E7Q5L7_9GAMM|nr:SDR family NAD(P)-dependent oxidoreductase [Rheinheimera salexigens]OEY69358.1 short-chain dehydrogenase [Rheinheimera salexigens]